MNLAPAILGTNAVNKLNEQRGAAVLQVGSDKLTRGQLAKVECFNFHAARMLSHVLKELKAPSLKYVYEKVPPAELALPHLGVVSLAVLGAAWEAIGVGGEAPLESYVKRHLNGGKVVTFHTLKERERERQPPKPQPMKRPRRRARMSLAQYVQHA